MFDSDISARDLGDHDFSCAEARDSDWVDTEDGFLAHYECLFEEAWNEVMAASPSEIAEMLKNEHAAPVELNVPKGPEDRIFGRSLGLLRSCVSWVGDQERAQGPLLTDLVAVVVGLLILAEFSMGGLEGFERTPLGQSHAVSIEAAQGPGHDTSASPLGDGNVQVPRLAASAATTEGAASTDIFQVGNPTNP